MGLLPDEMARQDLVARGVGHLSSLDSLSRSAVQGTEGVPRAGEPQIKYIAQLREVEATSGDDVPYGDRIVEVHERVDTWRLATFEGAPKEGFDRAGEVPAGDARGGHGAAPGRDAGVGLRVAIIGG